MIDESIAGAAPDGGHDPENENVSRNTPVIGGKYGYIGAQIVAAIGDHHGSNREHLRVRVVFDLVFCSSDDARICARTLMIDTQVPQLANPNQERNDSKQRNPGSWNSYCGKSRDGACGYQSADAEELSQNDIPGSQVSVCEECGKQKNVVNIGRGEQQCGETKRLEIREDHSGLAYPTPRATKPPNSAVGTAEDSPGGLMLGTLENQNRPG